MKMQKALTEGDTPLPHPPPSLAPLPRRLFFTAPLKLNPGYATGHYRTPFLLNDLCTGSSEQIQQRSISCLLLGALWPSNQRQHHGEGPRGPRDVGTIHQAPSDATVGECPDTRTTWTTDQSDSDPSTPRGSRVPRFARLGYLPLTRETLQK